LEQMRELKTGPNVVVCFESSGPQKYHIDYDRIPGVSELAITLLNPFAHARRPQVPSIFHVISVSMLAHGPQNIAVGEGDVLVRPPIPLAVSFMDWSRHSELYLDAYDSTARWIEERLREKDLVLQALFDA
jgi:NTE family protein